MPDPSSPTLWERIRRNPHRIAVGLFAIMLAVVVFNAISVDNDATTFPTASEADGDVPSPRATPDTSNTAGLIAGFGLFGLWAVLGIVAFTRPKRRPARSAPPDDHRSSDPGSTAPRAIHGTGRSSRSMPTRPEGDPSLN